MVTHLNCLVEKGKDTIQVNLSKFDIENEALDLRFEFSLLCLRFVTKTNNFNISYL